MPTESVVGIVVIVVGLEVGVLGFVVFFRNSDRSEVLVVFATSGPKVEHEITIVDSRYDEIEDADGNAHALRM